MSTAMYSDRLDRALVLAADSFRYVDRKGSGIPYLTHLLAVTVTVAEHGGTEDQMISAVLHDYLEDIDGTTPEGLREQFVETVANYVVALSDTLVRPKPPWIERKTGYLARLVSEPAEVKLISAADKLHNSSSILRDHVRIGDSIFDRFSAEKDEVLWYFREVVVALGHDWSHPLLDELERKVAELQTLG